MHKSLPANRRGMGYYRALVDLMGHSELGGKTVLYIVDGLFAGQNWDSRPVKWNMAPFYDDWPSSVFVSQDPVAIDSVCCDFLQAEWNDYPHYDGADDYLHEAALAGNPPSGTFYDPNNNGIGLASLGVHEHWNDLWSKQYSRNLGSGDGIELTSPLPADFNGDGVVDCKDFETLMDQWLLISEQLPADIAPGPTGDGIVDMEDLAMFVDYWTG